MKKFKVVIVDDEYLLADLIETYLAKFDEFEIVGKFNDPTLALNTIKANKIDLVFLDIEMPTMSGVDLARFIPDRAKIVFTTAYSEYAVKGFEINALDYLLKPISFARFTESIHRFLDAHKDTQTSIKDDHYLVLKSDGDLYRVPAQKIVYIQSLREYLKYQLAGKKLIVYGSLTREEENLATIGFLRIHKSYLVNKNHISRISGNQVFLSTEENIPIGRAYKHNLAAL